jgi:7-cyano-7-deazaguanine reductase
MNNSGQLDGSVLGKSVEYPEFYNPLLLQSIPRALQRKALKIGPEKISPEKINLEKSNLETLPFFGWDVLNHYEISYLLNSGKPVVGILEIYAPANSPNLVESKSLKLYFNSLNMHKFKNTSEFLALIQKDLDQAYGAPIRLKFYGRESFNALKIEDFSGVCLDELDIFLDQKLEAYLPCKELLFLDARGDKSAQEAEKAEKAEKAGEAGEAAEAGEVEETLYSNLLKSNCLITGQPDWASIQIYYRGPKINRESLLKYLISFRQHQEFHEHCVERIFMDILRQCRPRELAVFGRYTRRGGIDINPLRLSSSELFEKLFQGFDSGLLNIRHARQ